MMWLLNFLPDFIFDLLMLLGVLGIAASLVLKSIPIISKYNIPILVVSILITVIAAWYNGAIAKDTEYKLAIEEMKLKVAESEKLAAEANAQIEYIFIDRIQPIKDVQVVVQEKIKNVAVNIDDNCKITVDTIDILNSAAQRPGNKQ